MKPSAMRTITVQVPFKFTKRGGRKVIHLAAAPVPAPASSYDPLIIALAKAHRWRNRIESGEFASITELANAEKINQSYACRILRLSLLSPEIVERALDGRLANTLLLKDLLAVQVANWQNQANKLSCNRG